MVDQNNSKISIITPSFNQGQFIEHTILSVLDQDYDNYELIIIDGGSTDNTVDIIKKYEDRIAFWVSEPDKGQADAINKGLRMATGAIFNWLNSDDLLEPGALRVVADFFIHNSQKQVLCGYTRCFFNEDNSTSHEYRMGLKSSVTDTIINVEMNQPGTFYKTAVIKDLGGVNESLRYVFDDELWFRYICKNGLSFVGMSNKRLAQFRLHKASKSIGEGYDLFAKELQSIYVNIAENIHAPDWLINYMKKSGMSPAYTSSGNWNSSYLNTSKYMAYFAYKYINALYLSGQKRTAAEAMKMIIDNGYFKRNRMMLSLRLKLLFY